MLDRVEIRGRDFAESGQGRIERLAVGGNRLDQRPKIIPVHPLRLGVFVELAMRILPGAWIELDLIERLHREPARQTAGAASFHHLKVPVGAASSPSRAPPERRPPPCCPPCRRLDRPPAPSCRW